MLQETTARSVTEHLCVSAGARNRLRAWRQERPEVAEYVLSHVTRVLYTTSVSDLRKVASATEHALGKVKREEGERVWSIRDWNPRFAMTHVLHYALERLGAPFTYQEFRSFCSGDAAARGMLWVPAQAAIGEAAATYGVVLARAAMRWRIGNSYYSFLRELVVRAELRDRGLDLEMHPLADALFRVDAWSGQTVVGLYIGNRAFLDGAGGRKPRTETVLGPSFRYVAINMPTQHAFGRLHVPTADALDEAAANIRAAQAT